MPYLSTFAALLLMACQASSSPAAYQTCFASPPGEEGIPLNTPDAIRLEKLNISASGEIWYLATEYLGAPNLQSSIYVKVDGKYCLAGELGAFAGFSLEEGGAGNSHRDLIIRSKSGEFQFSRRFEFRDGYYKLRQCTVMDSKAKIRSCTRNEE